MATKKKAAPKKAAVKKEKPVTAPKKAAVKKVTKEANGPHLTDSVGKPTKAEFNKIQKVVFDSENKNISDAELHSAITTVIAKTSEKVTSPELRTELYALLRAWGYTTPE